MHQKAVITSFNVISFCCFVLPQCRFFWIIYEGLHNFCNGSIFFKKHWLRLLEAGAISMNSERGTKCSLSVSVWRRASWGVWHRQQREERIWEREGLLNGKHREVEAGVWQQVLTVRGPWEECYWQHSWCEVRPSKRSSNVRTESKKRGQIKGMHMEQWALLYMCMKRGVELQDVYRGGGSRCGAGFGMTFTKNNLRCSKVWQRTWENVRRGTRNTNRK